MEIITSLDAELKNKYPATVIALGTFDGLHLGHTDVINTAKDYAERSGLKLAVFTFSNHPLALIRPPSRFGSGKNYFCGRKNKTS